MPDAFATGLYAAINTYRLDQGRIACQIDMRLERAAALHIEWLAASANKTVAKTYPKADHVTNCAWLLKAHPELNWAPILATYQGVYPVQLGAFDMARLCGYLSSGLVADTGYFGKAQTPNDVFNGWMQSPTHNRGMLLEQFRFFGIGKGAIGGGKTAVFCFYAEPPNG